ncbi:MAG TPA: hypothetical protein VMD30_01320 [Tepidisphaeraceae bacterium]|nr:hypothetical protein [Tepidisphaeraceae bacterium]
MASRDIPNIQFSETANMRRIAIGAKYWWLTALSLLKWGAVGAVVGGASELPWGDRVTSSGFWLHVAFCFLLGMGGRALVAVMPRDIRISGGRIAIKNECGKWKGWRLADLRLAGFGAIAPHLIKIELIVMQGESATGERISFLARPPDAERVRAMIEDK